MDQYQDVDRLVERSFITGVKTGIALSAGVYLAKKIYTRGLTIQVNWNRNSNQ